MSKVRKAFGVATAELAVAESRVDQLRRWQVDILLDMAKLRGLG